jgi:hypothetical protein
LAERGRAFVENNYSWEKHNNKLAAVIFGENTELA